MNGEAALRFSLDFRTLNISLFVILTYLGLVPFHGFADEAVLMMVRRRWVTPAADVDAVPYEVELGAAEGVAHPADKFSG